MIALISGWLCPEEVFKSCDLQEPEIFEPYPVNSGSKKEEEGEKSAKDFLVTILGSKNDMKIL